MKLRLPTLLLAVCLLLTTPALAATNSTENFIRTQSYQGQFSDLTQSSPFYPNVTALYEYGLSVGKPDGTFGLNDSLTVGQVVIFAGRIRSLYCTGSPEAGPAVFQSKNQPVSTAYLLYLKNEGILGNELDSRLYAPATRAEVAHVLANLLPAAALPPVHDALVTEGYATHRYVTDVTEYTPYFRDILQLYRTGISQGCDQQGSYCPSAPITRGAAAAMLTRMVDPTLRVAPTWYVAAGRTMASLVPDAKPVRSPDTAEEMDACIRHMLFSGTNVLRLTYPSLSEDTAQDLMTLALSTIKTYCEQSYNTVTCTYTSQGTLTLIFSSTAAGGSRLKACRQDAMHAAIALHDQFWRDGTITSTMSDHEKAKVYFDWICQNTVYDTQAADNSISHLPCGVFSEGKAVCDGYTGAYNLLLKLEGISCTALSNDTHIWTVAILDGEEVHIDTTWGDQASGPDARFFAMTPAESQQQHSWP